MAKKYYVRRFGDRVEGRQVRSFSSFFKLTPHLIKNKSDASIFFQDTVDVAEADRYFFSKKSEGYDDIDLAHLFVAAYVRTVALLPGMNRFVSGQRIYARHEIEVVLKVKRAVTSEDSDSVVKVVFDANDTIFDVHKKTTRAVDTMRASVEESALERQSRNLIALPRPVLRMAIGFSKFLDYFGWLPTSILNRSQFHGSMMLSDFSHLSMPPTYTPLPDYGNLPLHIGIGTRRKFMEIDKTGHPAEKQFVDYCMVLDSRICDNYYYSSAIKYIKYFLLNPALLEIPPENINDDIF